MKAKDRKGLFITFEKTAEGLGGTTQAFILAEELRKRGHSVVLTREPGGTELGAKIRELTHHWRGDMSHATELFLMNADRAQHYKEVLKPSLLAGKIVVCDRYVDSTIAYQGGGRGFKKPDLWRLHALATGGLMPDLTFVLDGKPHRVRPNDDRFEKLDEAFFRRVKRAAYDLLRTEPNRCVGINANRPIEAVSADIMEHVENLLKGWARGNRENPST